MTRAVILCSAIFGLLLLFHNVDSSTKSRVITLDEDNWEQMLEGEWMVKLWVFCRRFGIFLCSIASIYIFIVIPASPLASISSDLLQT